MDRNACLELALEGERLCKNGDFNGGVAFFEAAIRVGTDDMRTLSAVYSQLGNAYFYLGDYFKALEYHKCDLAVARAINDELGEGKASGNLGNTLKVMGKYEEAVACCERHLAISKKLKDKVGEGRALYNLGNVYHAKGKRFACLGHQDPGEFPEEVKICLQKAVTYYEDSLQIMTDLGDRSAQGRACGNLGNTHYLLGNFSDAITYHEERLIIAKEYSDIAAERRAHNNLGNAHIFLGEFVTAAEHYKKTLQLAVDLLDKAIEAQACYSLGNTYTLLHDYPTAIDYHLRHLKIAQELRDRVGEGRAYWSLGNAHSAIGNHAQALHYASRHLEISREIGDQSGEITAQHSILDIQKMIEQQQNSTTEDKLSLSDVSTCSSSSRLRRVSMEHMDLLKLTPDAKLKPHPESRDRTVLSPVSEGLPNGNDVNQPKDKKAANAHGSVDAPLTKDIKHPPKKQGEIEGSMDEESFFDLLSHFQSKRMDDQRCSLAILENKENNQLLGNRHAATLPPTTSANQPGPSPPLEGNGKVHEDLFDLIAGMQSRRMDEQRASLPCLPSLTLPSLEQAAQQNNNNNHIPSLQRSVGDAVPLPDDDFFDMLMRCQASRLEDQRSSMPNVQSASQNSFEAKNTISSAPTVPDEDFFSLIMRFQAGRIEDQRSALPGSVKSDTSSDSSKVGSQKKSTTVFSRSGIGRNNIKATTSKGSLKH